MYWQVKIHLLINHWRKMAVTIRRTRWPEGATQQEILDAAQHEEKKDVSKIIRLLLQYFKFPSVKAQLKLEGEEFVKRDDFSPREAAEMYRRLCFFKEANVAGYMEVGDAVYVKFDIYWVQPVQSAAYIFEYAENDDEVQDGE